MPILKEEHCAKSRHRLLEQRWVRGCLVVLVEAQLLVTQFNAG